MRRPTSVLSLALGFTLLLQPRAPVAAQANAQNLQSTTSANKAQSDPKILNLPEYGRWNRVTSTALTADGKWMSYAYQPNEGDATLHIKQLDGDKLYTIPIGSAPAGGGRGGGGGAGGGGGGGGPQFSDDSKWVVYFVNPPEAAGRGGRGGGGGGGRGANPPGGRGRGAAGADGAAGPVVRHLELLELATGTKFSVPNAASFKFSNESKWLAIRLNKSAPNDTSHSGADLLIRELGTGNMRNVGNVNQYEFDDAGKLLAYTVDASGKLGNGVYLINLATGETRALDSEPAVYDQLVWSEEGANLAVYRGDKPKDKVQRENTLLAWTGLGALSTGFNAFDPAKDAGFPRGYVLSEFTAPRWSKDGSKLFVGIKEQENERPKSDEPQANVDVWHWKDAQPQSVQMVRLAQDRRATNASVFLVASRKFLQLADSNLVSAQATPNSKWAVGRVDTTYRGEVEWGASRSDYYRVNVETGDRALIEKKLSRTMGTSNDSKWFLYLRNQHIYAYNFDSGKSAQIDGGMNFIDQEDDHAYERPTYGTAGWSKDGHSVLVYDKYDVWQLSLDGGKPVNLTGGAGKAHEIRFRVVRLGAGGGGGRGGRGGGRGGAAAGGEDEGIDLSKPITLSAYGEWTKRSGYWRLSLGTAPKPLIWEDKQIGAPDKAKDADRVILTEQTFKESPDVWVTNSSFESPRKVTDANPFISEYAWGSRVLVDFKNSKGQKLQATLTLPAGYQPGKKYPMLVYFYELLSNTHHLFSMPAFDDRPQMSTYASNGYLVLEPDVVYEIGKPGSSAVDCVTSAVKKVIELGYADPKHIGLQGHSWGGYQSSYIVTQTNIFAAVVTGAPPTNLISFYDELYKQTGTVQQGITEVGQVRMGENVTPWTAKDLYENQSPVFNVQKITTPFLILQGTADGAVDWDQGLEFFNAARRNGKQVIFLSYPDEPHHLAKKENQKDFQVRMKQFFDHYLMDTPAPKWMTEGVPQVKKGGAIQ